MNRYPTVALDYQISERHRVTWSMNIQYIGGGPDTTNNRENFFPGFPVQANQSSDAPRDERLAAIDRSARPWSTSSASATAAAPVVFAQNEFKPDDVERLGGEPGRLLPEFATTR